MPVIRHLIPAAWLTTFWLASAVCAAQTEPDETAPPAPDSAKGAAAPDGITPDGEMATMVRTTGDSELLAQELNASATWLEAGGEAFLALWQQDTSGSPKGALLMLHAEGQTANGQGTFTWLRRQLPEHGWATLSVSLPLPATPPLPTSGSTATNTIEDVATAGTETGTTEEPRAPPSNPVPPAPDPEAVTAQRISAAIAYLQQNSQVPMVILGEGTGAARAIAYLSVNGRAPFKAAVLLNARNNIPGQDAILPNRLTEKTLPVLDLYSGQHFLDARESAARRKAARVSGLENYRQIHMGPQPGISEGPTPGSRQVRGFLHSLLEKNPRS